MVIHSLPFWFLVFALFLPRVALCVAWFQQVLVPFHLFGLIPLIAAIVLPRADSVPYFSRPGDQRLVSDSPGGGIDGLGRLRTLQQPPAAKG